MQNKFLSILLISCLILGNFFIWSESIKAADTDIKINEVMYDPIDGAEWVELCNSGLSDVDLDGWILTDEDGIEEYIFTNSLMFPVGSFLVIRSDDGDDDLDFSDNLGVIYANHDSDYSSTYDQISLYNNLAEIMDFVAWGGDAGLDDDNAVAAGIWVAGEFLENINNGNSLGLIVDGEDSNNLDDWQEFDNPTYGVSNKYVNKAPEIMSSNVTPGSIIAGEENYILFEAEISDLDGLADIDLVSIDLSEMGGSDSQLMYDDGISGDIQADDGIYSFEYLVPIDILSDSYDLLVNVVDSAENEVEDSINFEIIEPTYSDQIRISEILPNPKGSDGENEFIELQNIGRESVNLESWQIGDASSRYMIDSGEILAGDYLAIYRRDSGISLNNSGGETVNLYQPNGNLLDTITYSESVPEGQSYNLSSDSWQWSVEITPGEENQIILENHDPKALAGNNQEVEVGEEIIFDASSSSDSDGDMLSYTWNFGNGQRALGSKVKYSYTKAGTYTVELKVSDGRGGQDSDALKVKVLEPEISDSEDDSNLNSEQNIVEPFSTNIIITEVLPNPEGSDTVDEGEFIEIYNKGNKEINLESWQIDDEEGGSSPYTIEDKTIKPGEYLVLWRGETKLSLNNSDEKARLIHPDDKVVSEVYYEESAKENYAYALDESSVWQWTDTPTPGEANTISGTEEESDSDDSSNSDSSEDEESNTTSKSSDTSKEDDKKSDQDNLNIISIKEVKTKDKNTEVKVQGIVISEPGLFSKKTFYIQDESSGIQIYFSKEDFPKLELGDEVIVSGKKSESGGENKINIASKDDIQILGHKSPPEAKEIKTGELKEDFEGQLIKVVGEIAKKSGNVFYLDDGSGQAKVYINKNTGIQKPELEKGDKVTILGIESETSSGYRVLPRYQSDLREVDSGILTSMSNSISGSIPQAGGDILFLFIFAFICTLYVVLPKWAYVWRKGSL